MDAVLSATVTLWPRRSAVVAARMNPLTSEERVSYDLASRHA